ncbi:hypothetical protein [Candidatus Electrothrix sp.]|uniref:hypothetical protein n=1 Tax=Candidatus Electrothrix sp. TaxID=2170559 RepID=UPI00405670BF
MADAAIDQLNITSTYINCSAKLQALISCNPSKNIRKIRVPQDFSLRPNKISAQRNPYFFLSLSSPVPYHPNFTALIHGFRVDADERFNSSTISGSSPVNRAISAVAKSCSRIRFLFGSSPRIFLSLYSYFYGSTPVVVVQGMWVAWKQLRWFWVLEEVANELINQALTPYLRLFTRNQPSIRNF